MKYQIATPNKKKRTETKLRQEGYDDGLANRPAKLKDINYQLGWRRGREAATLGNQG